MPHHMLRYQVSANKAQLDLGVEKVLFLIYASLQEIRKGCCNHLDPNELQGLLNPALLKWKYPFLLDS